MAVPAAAPRGQPSRSLARGPGHTYPVREIFTIISAGRPTEVGLRGYPAVQTIIAAGADDQRGEDVLRRVFGDAVGGLEQLRRRT